MRRLARAFGFAAAIAFVRAASAEVTDAEPATIEEAQRAFDEAQTSFEASGTDCVTLCRALQSMARAADRICALTPPGDETAKHRCEDARAKVDAATKKVLASCPACNPRPPTSAADEAKTGEGAKKAPETAPPPPSPTTETMAYGEYAGVPSLSHGRLATLAVSPLALVSPPFLVEGHFEANVGGPLSLLVRGGFGRMRTAAGGDERVSVWRVGGALRSYVGASFAGPFLGLEGNWDHAEKPVVWSHFVPGFTFGPVVGYKLVTAGGFTLETQIGVAAVAVDRRDEVGGRPKVVPTWDLSLGYSF